MRTLFHGFNVQPGAGRRANCARILSAFAIVKTHHKAGVTGRRSHVSPIGYRELGRQHRFLCYVDYIASVSVYPFG